MLREWSELLKTNLFVKGYNLCVTYQEIRRYWRAAQFRKVDLHLLREYLICNPYRESRRFLVRQGAQDIYGYGTTPLTTLETIARAAGFSENDVVYDLGCGTGRTSFWLRCMLGCRVVGIEQVPLFMRKAERVRRAVGVEGVTFVQGDMLQHDYAGATAVYLYGTCLDDATIERLIEKLRSLPIGATVATVSYPLTDYVEGLFQVVKSFEVSYAWGSATVYIQKRV